MMGGVGGGEGHEGDGGGRCGCRQRQGSRGFVKEEAEEARGGSFVWVGRG